MKNLKKMDFHYSIEKKCIRTATLYVNKDYNYIYEGAYAKCYDIYRFTAYNTPTQLFRQWDLSLNLFYIQRK